MAQNVFANGKSFFLWPDRYGTPVDFIYAAGIISGEEDGKGRIGQAVYTASELTGPGTKIIARSLADDIVISLGVDGNVRIHDARIFSREKKLPVMALLRLSSDESVLSVQITDRNTAVVVSTLSLTNQTVVREFGIDRIKRPEEVSEEKVTHTQANA